MRLKISSGKVTMESFPLTWNIYGLIWPRRFGAVTRQPLFIVCGAGEIFWGATAVFVWQLKEMASLTEKVVMHANEYTPRREGELQWRKTMLVPEASRS